MTLYVQTRNLTHQTYSGGREVTRPSHSGQYHVHKLFLPIVNIRFTRNIHFTACGQLCDTSTLVWLAVYYVYLSPSMLCLIKSFSNAAQSPPVENANWNLRLSESYFLEQSSSLSFHFKQYVILISKG